MISFEIIILPLAQDQLNRQNNKEQKLLIKSIKKLKIFPASGDIKKLKGYKNLYRLRVGNWRIIFEYNFPDKIVNVITIGLRKEVYKNL